MGMQNWVTARRVAPAAGSSFGSFTTAKTVIPPTGLYVIRAGQLFVGAATRISVVGGIGNLITTPGTIEFQVKIGSVVAFTSGAIQLNATAHTNLPFWLQIMLTCRSIGDGTNAKLIGQALAFGNMFTVTAAQVDGLNTHAYKLAPATAPAEGTGFDSTADQIVDFWAGFSINDAANTIQIQQYLFEPLNWD